MRKSGTVLAQSPGPGTTLPIRSTVTLVVSQGPKPQFVPSIVSQTVDDARANVATRKLQLNVTERVPNDHIAADAVISQDPAAGTSVPPGSTVNVVVSSGPPQLSVPDTSGLQLADAAAKLEARGLLTTIVYAEEPTAPVGTVISQQPGPSAATKKGATVTLTIAVPGTIPDVSGKMPAQASALLQNYGYKIGNTAYKQEGTEGTVVGHRTRSRHLGAPGRDRDDLRERHLAGHPAVVRILGVDPGLRVTGYGAVDATRGRESPDRSGHHRARRGRAARTPSRSAARGTWRGARGRATRRDGRRRTLERI